MKYQMTKMIDISLLSRKENLLVAQVERFLRLSQKSNQNPVPFGLYSNIIST
jgi:hypothetical protein